VAKTAIVAEEQKPEEKTMVTIEKKKAKLKEEYPR